MTRWLLVGVLAWSCWLCSGCATRQAPAWMEAVAWWSEDVVRGVPRAPGELRRDDGPAALRVVAEWVQSDGERLGYSDALSSRRSRWPALRSALLSGHVRSTAQDGLVLTATGATRIALFDVVEAERADRAATIRSIAALVGLGDRDGTQYAACSGTIMAAADAAFAQPGLQRDP